MVLRVGHHMAVRVDTNAGETALFAALQARLGAEQVVRERLDVGDVVLQTDDGGAALVVERKTWADLASSLTDGRYAEQKARLLAVAAAAAAPAAPSHAEAQPAAPASAQGTTSSIARGAPWAFLAPPSRDGGRTLVAQVNVEPALPSKRGCAHGGHDGAV